MMGTNKMYRMERIDMKFGRNGKKPRSRAELEDLLGKSEIQALINESRAQVARGEYTSVPIHEIKRRLGLGD